MDGLNSNSAAAWAPGAAQNANASSVTSVTEGGMRIQDGNLYVDGQIYVSGIKTAGAAPQAVYQFTWAATSGLAASATQDLIPSWGMANLKFTNYPTTTGTGCSFGTFSTISGRACFTFTNPSYTAYLIRASTGGPSVGGDTNYPESTGLFVQSTTNSTVVTNSSHSTGANYVEAVVNGVVPNVTYVSVYMLNLSGHPNDEEMDNTVTIQALV